jgi:cytochrome o ubiquinol oxidase subunit I
MVVLGVLGACATTLAFAWREEEEIEISAEELARVDRARAGTVR